MKQLKHFRKQIDQFLATHPQSPLEHNQRLGFSGLNYYEPNPDLVFEVNVTQLNDPNPITVETSTGDRSSYYRYAQFDIDVDGAPATLTILSDQDGGHLFLPFRDATSGKETYGAGRYMDNDRPAITRLGRDRYRIDFNFAYNPYCAYQNGYSCPLPPPENWLSVPIEAGEKKFSD